MEKRKILIVDDEEDVLKGLEKRLSVAGYSVLKATSGIEAVAAAKRELPDLIVLDIVMPGMDGGQTAYALKEDPATKDIPVIFLTCLITREETGQTSAAIDGEYFIAKPYDPNGLLKEISKHLK
ncbi:MAG: two-component system response regulator [Candidatus Omnitrophica bacterium CG11_big_fil_rev_8_21_14_0_20_42_13]|uniref:Two-component system response regulator n=1 Tax=Candidatus Ghiorseimicrobium undicola TaxID=1974746 RepID=A0A2H0LW65_9BACT|nr:MAG: two-component system response regulator [Candidatus Omnitrophica bacterium CG11_big_fil_rev_8_21_14_0_20_42_13]